MNTMQAPPTLRFGQPQRWQWRDWSVFFTYQPCTATTILAPVLLLHGFGASHGHWRHNIHPLAQQRSVYALDLLGFGGSAKPEIEYTVNLWVDQVYEFWQAHIQQPVILTGHSIGGLAGVILAARHPEMIKGLCLISCADGPHPDDLPDWLGWLVQGFFSLILGVVGFPLTYPYLFRWLRHPEVLRGWIEGVYQHREQVDDELVEIFRRPAFDPGADYVFMDALRAILLRRFDGPQRLLPRVQAPILLLWGREDPAVPSFLADKFKAWQPQLQLVKLPGVGHCAHDELPLWVNTLILEWAADLELLPRRRRH
jgi:haloalkane dehalogenase